MSVILWVAQYCSCRFTAAPIVLELQARGHRVVALSSEAGRTWFGDLGVEFRPDRRIPTYDWGSRDLRPLTTVQERSPREVRRWFIERIPDQMHDVLEVAREEGADLVLTDFMLHGPGFAAELIGLPWVSYINCIFDESVTGEAYWRSWWDEMRIRVGLAPESRPTAELSWWTLSPHLNLLLSLPDLTYRPAVLPSYSHRVGPCNWDPPFEGPSPDWLERLGRDRPAVVLSTSSAWQGDAELVRQAAEGLAGEDLDLAATLPGRDGLTSLPDNVVVTGRFPHGLLFPRAAAVVCSGGAGITNRALSLGVPLVIVPRNVRDEVVAKAAVAAGAAVALEPDELNPGVLREAVLNVLGQPGFAAAAGRMAEAARSCDGPRTSADLIEALLR